MSLLLTLDTATEKATVLLQDDEQLLAFRQNDAPMQHAAFIQPAIATVCSEAGVGLSQVSGVVVVNGPGSYTGLRVGLSTAKGICFALGLPLYELNTLTVMAAASIRVWKESGGVITSETVFCPMIDARRMEVFSAIYTENLEPIIAPCALILDTPEGINIIKRKNIIFSGSGSKKLHTLQLQEPEIFPDLTYSPSDICKQAFQQRITGSITNLAYTEPIYIKEFYNSSFTKSQG
ncbi:MAG: tRNA (adenosine(37)-N6)-threonylcarbamoyltransferase complex dimerization subunit type 1 TsaB [Sediminibacterium sp.]|nr:tRNA (adenosine(37)-N6)-threonylcarbamoyltransferase complex dimerization subunit type 1 TsaB [Sediminibacterium sp.]